MDGSNEQEENSERSMCESFEPSSNVTVEKVLQSQKQRSQRTATDPGTEMDASDEKEAKADSSIRERLEPTSNVTLQRRSFPRGKLQRSRCSISRGTVTTDSLPKYRIIERFTTSTKNPPLISNAELPSETENLLHSRTTEHPRPNLHSAARNTNG